MSYKKCKYFTQIYFTAFRIVGKRSKINPSRGLSDARLDGVCVQIAEFYTCGGYLECYPPSVNGLDSENAPTFGRPHTALVSKMYQTLKNFLKECQINISR